MVGFPAVKKYLENNNLFYFSLYPTSEKPIKAVIHYLPQNTPAEDISDGLVSLGFDIIGVKQMTATRRIPPEVTSTVTFLLFLNPYPEWRSPKNFSS
jgi:hypothetical protein